MIRQVVGTVIGTLLFCVVALGILDYFGLVKIFNIGTLMQKINTSNTLSTGIVLSGDMVEYDGKSCPVGMVTIWSDQGLVCQKAANAGHDCIGLDGEVISDGQTTTGYKSNYSGCDTQSRLCKDGVLGGDESYALSSCQTYISGAQDCTVDDLVVAEYNTIVRRGSDVSDRDTSCSYIKMVCEDNMLVGVESYTGSACRFKQSFSSSYLASHPTYIGDSGQTIDLEYVGLPGAKNCTTPRGSGVEDGKSILSFKYDSVPYKEKCIYNLSYCKDGVLDDTTYQYSRCEIQEPASCTTPWGSALKHGQSVTGYQMIKKDDETSFCDAESRLCVDGKLSGSYELNGCTKEFNKLSSKPLVKKPLPVGQCKTPRGTWIDNGRTIVAYSTPSVSYDQYCQSETRTCRNGVLDGTFTARSCVVGTVRQCTTPRGTPVKHGESVFAYADKAVGYGSVCASETRYCNDGILDGSFQYASCSVGKPIECPLPWGATIAHGQSVFAYQKTQVPYGQTCSSVAEQRRCNNGVLGGSYMFEGCEVEPAADCATNRGTIKHGKTIARYQSPQVYGQVADGSDQCVRFTLTCTNGQVGGTLLDHPEAIYKSCTVVFPDDPN